MDPFKKSKIQADEFDKFATKNNGTIEIVGRLDQIGLETMAYLEMNDVEFDHFATRLRSLTPSDPVLRGLGAEKIIEHLRTARASMYEFTGNCLAEELAAAGAKSADDDEPRV